MKKYFVIGNPIDHSLSPEIHDYWIKKNKIKAKYGKKKLNNNDLKDFILKIRNGEINGLNVTVPFKKEIIPFLDKLTFSAETTQSVNTIYLENDKIIGHNTDIGGFEAAIKSINYKVAGKKVLILGAGGVVPSIIFALFKMKALSMKLTNRTKSKAEILKDFFNNSSHMDKIIKVINWGEIPNCDMIINATSVGLHKNDTLNLDFAKLKSNKFFYDIIYNPGETNFLKKAKENGHKTENGKKMFIYQAAEAFKIWHGFQVEINDEINRIFEK